MVDPDSQGKAFLAGVLLGTAIAMWWLANFLVESGIVRGFWR